MRARCDRRRSESRCALRLWGAHWMRPGITNPHLPRTGWIRHQVFDESVADESACRSRGRQTDSARIDRSDFSAHSNGCGSRGSSCSRQPTHRRANWQRSHAPGGVRAGPTIDRCSSRVGPALRRCPPSRPRRLDRFAQRAIGSSLGGETISQLCRQGSTTWLLRRGQSFRRMRGGGGGR